MTLCTNTFTKLGRDKRSELMALLVSILFSLIFLASFALLCEPEPVHVVASPGPRPQVLHP